VTTALALLPFLTLAVRPSHAVLLRYKFQPGETLKYVLKMSATGQLTTSMQPAPQPISVSGSAVLIMKVLGINPDGSYNLRITLQPKDLRINVVGAQQGQQPVMRPMTFRVVMTPLGEVRKIQLEGAQGKAPVAAPPGMGGGLDPSQFVTEIAGSIVFPKGDVQVGQVWTGRVKLSSPLLQQPLVLATKSKLVKMEPYMGRPCAVIDTVAEIPMNFSLPAFGITSSGRHTSVTRSYFDYEAGRVLCSKGQFKVAISSQAQFQQPGGATANFSMMFQMSGQVEVTLAGSA